MEIHVWRYIFLLYEIDIKSTFKAQFRNQVAPENGTEDMRKD